MAKERGRPSKYDSAYCERVVELGAQGKSQVQISKELGIPLSTIRSWADQHEDFSQALSRAKELEQAWWEDQAQMYLTSREFNAALWHKSVASRFREAYGEKQQLEHFGPNGGPIQTEAKIDPSGLSDSTLAELMAARKGEG
jgi:hypothetical protein